uniref:ninein-like protein isoform X1 n=1 Tax=Gasterosteus aculeatus aculeatus TaxID=481459 RepID=UPI001A99DE1C|nr:ninein-like protein isoform X1 [Gasterosteus aculeatus aculeatus]XP_040035406.1 ninein-like protein isoform X1 [Gasterosteus aculeatus aculeatus]XP_040035407.1 ninein-like protein isoform X1 [Gasterosteus aculeatus aculeatus]XP_040035408.1 ninein-like protein isoform X1 [Gasterosteus aculeatus aculeatus]
MQEAELSHYVTQLKVEFDGCDSTATGFLDREQLTELCRKLQLEAQRPVLLDTLLGGRHYAQVNFEEFKTGLVAVLSRSLDSSTSEDDSSYLEPVVREEVKPKFVKGGKRYGRRSQPDAAPTGVTDSPPSRSKAAASSPGGVRRAKVRRSTSLESIESLKTEEETGSRKERLQSDFQSKGPQQELDLGVVGRDGAGGLQQLYTEVLCEVRSSSVTASAFKQDVDALLGNAELDGRDFQKVLRCSAPVSCSTPVRSADLQRPQPWHQAALEERSVRSTSPSLLAATVGQRVLGRLDEGSGCTSPERVVALWTEEGIRNGRDILQTLDFPLEERLSLADLTLALDNELLVSGNGIHQAALISYKNEVQHLQVQVEQACRERDKMKTDLDLSHQRNLQLVREVDEHHSSLETLNQSRIRDLEQDFRDRLAAVRGQAEQESEALVQQAESERRSLRGELRLLRAQEAELREELCGAKQESSRLEEDLSAAKLKLTEAQSSVSRLQRDVDQLLLDKLGVLDPTGLSHEERFSQMVRDYEVQCRRLKELQDRNDELSSELELLKSQRSDRKSRRSAGDDGALSWAEQRRSNETNCDDVQVKTSLSPLLPKKPQPTDKTALCSLHSVSGPSVSIQTELAVEQLKTKQQQELQELHVQLETRVNYYERSLEVMRQSMEVERKDIAQAFKMEISELEEQKSQAEQEVKQLKEALGRLHPQAGGGGWIHGQERRMQRERAELEQNFAREIGNLVQRLSSEKDEMEAELKLEKDQEVMLVSGESALRLPSRMKLQRHERRRLPEQRGAEEQLSQSEASVEELRGRLEEELKACSRRCSELESRLEESISFLEALELTSQRLGSEKSSVQGELQQVRSREEQLLRQVTQMKEELGNLQTASNGVLQKRLQAREQRVDVLKMELESLQEDSRFQAQGLSKAIAGLDLLKMDRARLIQDLKDQAMAVDTLQLELDGVFEELDRRRSAKEALQEALKQEQTLTSLLQSALDGDKEEVHGVGQENGTYAQLVDQLSNQIVEMEEEISTLRDHLRELSAQLNDTADLVLDLRRQLNSKTSELDLLRAEVAELSRRDEDQHRKDLDVSRRQVLQLQKNLLESQNQLRTAEQDFEQEKRTMMQKLMELEKLVLDLEEVMDLASPHRSQLEEVRAENGALGQRLGALQQEVSELEDDVAKRTRKLDEMEREHERSREAEKTLHKENSRYREELLDLSARNLRLSADNGELSARLRGDQESLQMLRERLLTVSKEQEEGVSTERPPSVPQDQLTRLSALEAELSAETLKLQRLEEDKDKLLREADERNNKVEALQRALFSVEAEGEELRSQLRAVCQEKLGHAQEVSQRQRKVEELESSVRKLMRVEEELRQGLQEQQEEIHKLRVQNQELQHELAALQVQNQEQQILKTELMEAQDQVQRADAALQLDRLQHLRRLQEVQRQAGDGHREQEERLQARLQEEQGRSRQLEETLRLRAQHSSSHISMKQDQYEKAVLVLRQRTEELETTLKAVRLVLQEKVQQLKEQLAKNRKSGALLKDLHGENAQLMKALQVTEQRQKHAEKKNFLLEDRVRALNSLLREVVTAV